MHRSYRHTNSTAEFFGGVDGTGVYDDDKYEKEFANSFVNNFSKLAASENRFYVRGPSGDGFLTYSKAQDLFLFAKKRFEHYFAKGKYLKIMLAGYSRGGVSVCAASKLLNNYGIPVHGLFLLDPVDRSISTWGNDTVVHKNVSNVYRIQRHKDAGSRETFGTDCTHYWDGRLIDPPTKHFKTTHGGMGGAPWGKEGEANYYRFESDGIVDYIYNEIYAEGYYYDEEAPKTGVIDQTIKRVIYESAPDWDPTNLNAEEEKEGMEKARIDLKNEINVIRKKEACLKKLDVYKNHLKRSAKEKASRKDYKKQKMSGKYIIGSKL